MKAKIIDFQAYKERREIVSPETVNLRELLTSALGILIEYGFTIPQLEDCVGDGVADFLKELEDGSK